MHYSAAQATPMHPGMTPSRETLTKTPAYDPAWAATPAHPGFGERPSGQGRTALDEGGHVHANHAGACIRHCRRPALQRAPMQSSR